MKLGIIQARMNSTRLQGKVLLPIEQKPVLWHVYDRLTYSKKIDSICISTSSNKSDDPIVRFAEENKIKFYRGSETDLISRHYEAAKKYDGDIIIRITAGCPLVNPQIIDQLLELYEKNPQVDFVSNSKIHTFPLGLDAEIFPVRTLEKFRPISNYPEFYEYFISMYIYEHHEKFTSLGVQLKKTNLLRCILDYKEDYEFLKIIFHHLYKSNKIFLMNDILEFLRKNPEIQKINSMHYSKASYLKYKKEKKNAKQ